MGDAMTEQAYPPRLFHVTLEVRVKGIQEYGLNPMRHNDKAPNPRSYFVQESAVGWGIAHIARKYGIPVNLIWVLSTPRDPLEMKQLGLLKGVWYTTVVDRFCKGAKALHADHVLGIISSTQQDGLLADFWWK